MTTDTKPSSLFEFIGDLLKSLGSLALALGMLAIAFLPFGLLLAALAPKRKQWGAFALVSAGVMGVAYVVTLFILALAFSVVDEHNTVFYGDTVYVVVYFLVGFAFVGMSLVPPSEQQPPETNYLIDLDVPPSATPAERVAALKKKLKEMGS